MIDEIFLVHHFQAVSTIGLVSWLQRNMLPWPAMRAAGLISSVMLVVMQHMPGNCHIPLDAVKCRGVAG